MLNPGEMETNALLKDVYKKLHPVPDPLKPSELRDITQSFNLLCETEADRESWDLKQMFRWETILKAVLVEPLTQSVGRSLSTMPAFQLGEKIAVWAQKRPDIPNLRFLAVLYLDFLRTTEFRVRIYGQKKWEKLILDLIEVSQFTLRTQFLRNVNKHPDKCLFRVLKGNEEVVYSWRKTKRIIQRMLTLLETHLPDNQAKIALLMTNGPDMAMLDLACLFSGRVNVLIPANSTPEHIAFILNQNQAKLMFVTDSQLLEKVRVVKPELQFLEKVVFLAGSASEDWVVPYVLPEKEVPIPEEPQDLNRLATLMYTSGTTGEPKGIMFSQKNIIYKRFCRALAIPKIGNKDRFLCFLPLYHTFGRFFEMTGCIFWGSEYNFMENPSVQTMVANMRKVRPTVFISIPKKWIQLFERVSKKINLEMESPDVVKEALDRETGGELKWGLSAAGYLSPEVFNFFQNNGVELMSGFGMTEATGGISMTPPGEYKPSSLGKELPGIEVKLAEDGELLIRGPYVMLGYYGRPPEESFLEGGWLPTGDIMKQDEYGCLEIIDRKKEIYKNIRGETVSPQRVENLFRDFEEIQQVFLVGDHRPYNTVLIYPNPDHKGFFEQLDNIQTREFFSTVLSTVNRFLAPFERILDFSVIDRPFSADMDELTPKNTFKRNIIEKNFKKQIETMYEQPFFPIWVTDIEVRIPNWFLSQKGVLKGDIKAKNDQIIIEKLDRALTVHRLNAEAVQIGDTVYEFQGEVLDLQPLLVNPALWCGNQALYHFSGRKILQWQRQVKRNENLVFKGFSNYDLPDAETAELLSDLQKMLSSKEQSSLGIHLAAVLSRAEKQETAHTAFDYFEIILKDPNPTELEITNILMSRPKLSQHASIRRRMFIALLTLSPATQLKKLITHYLDEQPDLLDDWTIQELNRSFKRDEAVSIITEVLNTELKHLKENTPLSETPVPNLMAWFVEFGMAHPTRYREIRQYLVSYQLTRHNLELAQLALQARRQLQDGFRSWLGPNQLVAVGQDSGEEYSWNDVISFDEDVHPGDKDRMARVLSQTPLLREAIFLFSQKRLIRLQDLLPGGIWISFIRSHQKKTIYRVSIQTRFHGAFDITLNVNRGIPVDKVLEEVDWLILAGSKRQAGQTLVEDFGGYYEDEGIWSEEYVVEPTVARFLQRQLRKKDTISRERTFQILPYFLWNATTAFMRFWRMTGYETMIAKPSPENIIIPLHDYQRGTRLVSISERVHETSFLVFFQRFKNHFLDCISKKFDFAIPSNIWKFFFSGVITVEGEEGGKVLLRSLRRDLLQTNELTEKEQILEQLNEFLGELEDFGFNPKALTFAIRRFHRWYRVNRQASIEAQATMLNELYDTYSLFSLEEDYRDVRTRFFLQTVLEDSEPWVQEQLQNMAKKLKHGIIRQSDIHETISRILRQGSDLSERERYFLTRLSYPHIAPTMDAEFLQNDSHEVTLLVQLEDQDGAPYSIRQPISPREISKLYQLFMKANLQVGFRPEHHFLVAVSERGHIIGGLYYQYMEDNSVHMEKIVVSNHFRRKGISEGLMNELSNRLKNEHISFVSTGFFRPEYFYRFGFKIEASHAGLVKPLLDSQ